VQKGDVKITDLAPKTFDLVKPIIGIDNDYVLPVLRLVKRDEPNEYQEKAIRQALGSEVLFIWGPPGTGKTTTIAQIIEAFIEKNMSILLLAHTNVATDGAFADFLKLQK
jgi:superfamily II DNA or RNA helicase